MTSIMKPALYIKSSLVTTQGHALVIPPAFFETSPTAIGDREGEDGLEADETKLQLLPYITLMNDAGEVFCYYRGKAGEESRLHGALSIGLGGHVDTAVAPLDKLEHHLKREAGRELAEEAGIVLADPVNQLTFTHLIYDATNPVGRVHLGIRCVYRMTSADRVDPEKGTIEKGFFRHPSKFTPEEVVRMENWSQVCLNLLCRGL